MMVCALLALKSKELRSQEKIADVAGAEIGHHLRRMLQRREAEERRRRLAAQRPFHRAEALFDFILALLLVQLLVDEGGVRPGVRADGMAGRHHLLEDFGIVGGVLADREEDAGGAFLRQRLQDRGRIHRPRTVVERQHHFLVAQEVELLEMLEAETGTAGGVDLDGAADAERVRIVAGRAGRDRRRRRGRGRRCLRREEPRPWRVQRLRPRRARCQQRNRACKDQPCRNTHLVFPKFESRSRSRRCRRPVCLHAPDS